MTSHPLRNREWNLQKIWASPLKLEPVRVQAMWKGSKFLLTQVLESNDEDSEDEGLKMGDLIVPGSDQLRFDIFENLDIRMLSSIIVNDSSHTVINEYGSNLQKSKHDPLTTIEAKDALHGCKRSEFCQLED